MFGIVRPCRHRLPADLRSACDGVFRHPAVAAVARRVARRWVEAGSRSGRAVGFDAAALHAAVARQRALEAAADPGTPLMDVTEPSETAAAAAFAHTAVLACRPA